MLTKKIAKDIYSRQVEMALMYQQIVACLKAQEEAFMAASSDLPIAEAAAETLATIREKEERVADTTAHLISITKTLIDCTEEE